MAINLEKDNDTSIDSYEAYIMYVTNWYDDDDNLYESYYSRYDDMSIYGYDGSFDQIEDVRAYESHQSPPEFKSENQNKYGDKKIGKINDTFLVENKKLKNKYNQVLYKKWKEEATKPLELYKKNRKTQNRKIKMTTHWD